MDRMVMSHVVAGFLQLKLGPLQEQHELVTAVLSLLPCVGHRCAGHVSRPRHPFFVSWGPEF